MTTFPYPILDSVRLAMTVRLARQSALIPGAPILIQGEPGTGAEELARFIHSCAAESAARPFVTINCPGVSETTLDTELHGPPAREPAALPSMGRARGGTLFIEEVTCLGLRAQGALVGWLAAERSAAAAVNPEKASRVIAATSTDLRSAVRNRAFRPDLMNELSIVTLSLPALRDRTDDILPLAQKMLAAQARARGTDPKELSPAACEKLLAYEWPGNAPELQAVIERASLIEAGQHIGASSVIFADRSAARNHGRSFADAFSRIRSEQGRPPTLAELECAYLVWLLELTHGNRTAASRLLGVSYPTTMKKILDYKIDFNAIAARARPAI